MSLDSARALAALALFAPLSLAAQNLEYAPLTTHYRVSTTTNVVSSGPMGSQTLDVGVKQQITVKVARHAKDTAMATLTVDSIAITSTAPAAADVSKLVGSTFVSFISPTGKFFSSKGPDGLDAQLAQLADGIGRFLPAFHGDLATNRTWADTVAGIIQQNGLPVDRTAISRYTVTGDTTIAGETAYRVQRSTTIAATGAGSMQGMAVTMETTGLSTGTFFLTHKGVYLGGDSKDDASVKIVLTAQGAEVKLKQSQRTIIETIR